MTKITVHISADNGNISVAKAFICNKLSYLSGNASALKLYR